MQDPLQSHRSLSFFDREAPSEKGSSEWESFNTIQEDYTGGYPVRQPEKNNDVIVNERRNLYRNLLAHTRELRSVQ